MNQTVSFRTSRTNSGYGMSGAYFRYEDIQRIDGQVQSWFYQPEFSFVLNFNENKSGAPIGLQLTLGFEIPSQSKENLECSSTYSWEGTNAFGDVEYESGELACPEFDAIGVEGGSYVNLGLFKMGFGKMEQLRMAVFLHGRLF